MATKERKDLKPPRKEVSLCPLRSIVANNSISFRILSVGVYDDGSSACEGADGGIVTEGFGNG